MKVIKKPWFIKEQIGEKTYLLSKEDQQQVLVLREPQEFLVEHKNLKIPELQGQDGIIVDIELKTMRKVSYQIFGYAPSIYEMSQQLRYVYQLDESYLKWVLNQMVNLLIYTHCTKTMTCRGINMHSLKVEHDGTLKLMDFQCKRRVAEAQDTRADDIQALGNMLIELYFNIPEYKNYFSTKELEFTDPNTWKKFEMLSATFGQAPQPLSQEMKSLIASMINPGMNDNCRIDQISRRLKAMKRPVPKMIYITGAPKSGKKSMGSMIANEFGLNVSFSSPPSPNCFNIFYHITEQEMETRGADSDDISRFMRTKKPKAFKVNAMADPSTVFEQTKVVIFGGDPTEQIMSQLAFAKAYRTKCFEQLKQQSIIENFSTKTHA